MSFPRPTSDSNALRLVPTLLIVALVCACGPESEQAPGPVRELPDKHSGLDNPLLDGNPTPLGAPPFHRLQAEHFLPALTRAVDRAGEQIDRIAGQPEPPTFDNTIVALAEAEREIARIARLWFGLRAIDSASAPPEMSEEISAQLARHRQNVVFNRKLFERVERLHFSLPELPAAPEQLRLIGESWRRFRRSGAELDDEARQRLGEIDGQLAALDEHYATARAQATHRHELLIEDASHLDGLPDSLVALAERTARDRGHAGGWVFTLHAHSFYPFMRHSRERDFRRELYQAWMTRYRDRLRSDEDIGRLIERLAELRAERAELLGFDNHLEFLLEDGTLAGLGQLESLLERVTAAARNKSRDELAAMRHRAAEDGITELEPWDWWYYRERLLEGSADAGSDASLHDWFSLERVQEGAFGLATRLWGLTFHPRPDIPAWHQDASALEVRDEMGEVLGVLYLDPIHRRGKQGGAWTSHYRVQHRDGNERVPPVVAVVTNFQPPAAGQAALLTPEQARTHFHELGHALHSLLSDVRFAALAGTQVPPDFVEFPALLFERWALEPQVLRNYAWHHQTGAVIDDELIAALRRRAQRTAGLDMLELLAAIKLDLALHGAPHGQIPDLENAEQAVRRELDLPAIVSPHHHGGGLSSLFAERRQGGDFRTLWSEVLAADAFAAFEEHGTVNRELANRLRTEILARGNARDPMTSWRAFRGRAPELRHLLRERGLNEIQADSNTPSGE